MTNRLRGRSSAVAVFAIVLILGTLPLSPAHAAVVSTGLDDDAGFPLLGWLSYVAVAGLGLMTAALWVRLFTSSRSS